MMRTRDVVTINREGDFTPVVDLQAFRRPEENLRLCRSFCFTQWRQGDELGSCECLDEVRRGLVDGGANTWSLTANYGHGKTHFGVVLANFFGARPESPELTAVQEGLASAVGKEKAEAIFAFRDARPRPFLTLLLQGQHDADLMQAVLREVEREFERHPETRGRHLPVWQETARELLTERLEPDRRERARRAAEARGHDLEEIVRRLEERETTLEFRELCAAVVEEATGVPPNFAANLTFPDLFDTLYREYCGPDGPFEGVAVIFDEFVQFLGKALDRGRGEILGALVEPLRNRSAHGDALFVALGITDPRVLARQRHGEAWAASPIAKELDRISNYRRLRSDLEAVLDSLLAQNEQAFAELWQECRAHFVRAENVAWHAFPGKSDAGQARGPKGFRDVVTKGVFPLHPITTLLLTNLEFGVVQNPRGLLEELKRWCEEREEQPAVVGDGPNWVWPYEVFSSFGYMLRDDVQNAHRQAKTALGGDATEEQTRVIDCLALIQAAKIATPPPGGRESFVMLAAEMAALDPETAGRVLDDLHNRGIAEKEPGRGAFYLPQGASRHQFKTLLAQKVGQVSLDALTLEEFQQLIAAASSDLLEAKETPVPWGAAADWKFHPICANRRLLKVALITAKRELKPELKDVGTKDWKRGLVIAYLPFTQEDIDHVRENGPRLLAEVFEGWEHPPVVVTVPTAPLPAVENALRRVRATERFSEPERKEIGQQYPDGCRGVRKELAEALEGWKGSPRIRIVHPNLRDAVELKEKAPESDLLKVVLRKAYPGAPTTFVTKYDLKSTTHQNATAEVARLLCQNQVAAWHKTAKSGPATILVEAHLRDEWGMLTENFQLREPTDSNVLAIWELLNREVPVGGQKASPLRPVLQKLVLAPYGLDTCSLVLAVCGWLGYHGSGIKVFVSGRLLPLPEIGTKLKDILGNLLAASVRREDVDEKERRLKAWVEKTEAAGQSFTLEEANGALAELREAPESLRQALGNRVEQAIKRLEEGIQLAGRYVRLAKLAESRAGGSRKLQELLEALEELKGFELGLVREAHWPPPSEVRKQLVDAFSQFWGAHGEKYAAIASVEDYKARYRDLDSLANRLGKCHETSLARMVRETIRRLDDNKKRLETAEAQKPLLSALREYRAAGQTVLELNSKRKAFERQAEELAPLAADVQAALDAALAAIDEELARLRDLEPLRQKLGQVEGLKSAASLKIEIEGRIERLHGDNGALQQARSLSGEI